MFIENEDGKKEFHTGLFRATTKDYVIFHENHPYQFWLGWIYLFGIFGFFIYAMFHYDDWIRVIVSFSCFLALKAYDEWKLYTNKKDNERNLNMIIEDLKGIKNVH